jgi:hypothetical protein
MGPTSIVLLVLLAQAGTPAASPADKARATGLLREGNSLYKKGDYTGALDKFEAAYAAMPSPKLLFNIGQARRDLGLTVDAIEAFDKFLSLATDASPKTIAEARTHLADLQRKAGRLQILCETPGAVLGVDGKEVGVAPLPGPLWTAPGRHMITATHATAAPGLAYAEVTAGRQHTVTVRLSPLAPAAPPTVAQNPGYAPATQATVVPAPTEVQAPAAAPVAKDGGWLLGRKWAWVATGSAVLFAGSAAVIGAGAKSRYDELRSSCGSNSADRMGCDEGEINSLKTRVLTANVLWGLAGAAAVTAGVLFIVEDYRVQVAPLAGNANGLLARVEF